jgi:hypothetical protein
VIEDEVDGCVDGLPLFQQPGQDLFAFRRESVEALVPLVFFAPLAYEQALGFKSAQKRVKRAFVDFEASLGQIFAERVAVMLLAKLGEDGEGQAAAAKLEAKAFEEVFSYGHCCASYTVLHILYDN